MINKYITGLFCLLAVVMSGHVAYGADNGRVRLDVISVNDGLPQQTVTSVAEDKYGFMWFGTFDGLCRYDGFKFTTYSHVPREETSISNNRVLSLLLDSFGDIWIGTEGENGLNRYDIDTDSFEHVDFAGSKGVRALCRGKDGELWIGCATGLYNGVWQYEDGARILKISPAAYKSLNGRPCRQLVFDDEDRLWALFEGKLVLIENGTIKENYLASKYGRIESIYSDGHNNLFMCSRNDIFVRYSGANDFVPLNISDIVRDSEKTPLFNSIVQLDDVHYMVGTESDGAYIVDLSASASREAYKLNTKFFDNNILRFFYKDSKGLLWIGSGHNGLAKIDLHAKPFMSLALPDEDKPHFVRQVFKDSESRLWIGETLEGMYLYENGHYKKMDIDSRATYNAVMEDHNGNIWICANRYVYVYHNGRMYEMSELPGVPEDVYKHINHINAICEDTTGAIWIAGVGNMVRINSPFRPVPDKSEAYCCYSDDFTEDIYCMYSEKECDRLWCGSRSEGLFVLDIDDKGNVNGFQHIDATDGKINSNHIWSICVVTPGEAYIGTDSGLHKVAIGHNGIDVTNITVSPKISNRKIMAITPDKIGNIWLNTSQGLIKYNPATEAYSEYYYADGLTSNTMTEAACVDSSGIVYIGTVSGVSYFDPSSVVNDKRTISPRLVGLKINNVLVNPSPENRFLKRNLINTEKIVLGYHENNFALEFIAPYYTNQERIRYAYKMEGADNDWIEVPGTFNEATYSRLKSGNYRFLLKAANPDGVWDENIQSLEIKMKPAPWNAWWAWLCYFALLILIVGTIMRYYWLQYKFKNDARLEHLQREHEKILSELKLKFHTNISHEIKTALTLIKTPLDEMEMQDVKSEKGRGRMEIIKRNVDYLDSLVQQFLDLRKIDKEALPLCVLYDDAVPMVVEVYNRFKEVADMKHIDFVLDCEIASLYGWFDRDKLIKIISNLISNAIKYTPENGAVSLIVDQTGDTITIVVQDTGEGMDSSMLTNIFNRFYQGTGHENSGTGIGLALVQKLVELHRGKIEVVSHPQEGSTFTLTIPCTKETYPDLLAEDIVLDEAMVLEDSASKPLVQPKDKPRIVIIDDNKDIQEYLFLELTDDYNIELAGDAESGIEKVVKFIPDLIISDVMLPGRSGFDICSELKSNPLTCHIPIMILSAKGESRDVTMGYESGADDYLQKPFSNKVLRKKIQKLINDGARTANVSGKSDTAVIEDALIVKIKEIIAANYSNSEFRINDLCTELCMSHTQLYRKLKAVSEKTFSDMLRDYRMEKAYELLSKGTYNCSEVMFRVGISSNSYFTKTFREYYGIIPSALIKKEA